MPLYLCSTPVNDTALAERQAIAEAITRVHCEETGAPRKFVHVVFFGPAQASVFTALTGQSSGLPCQLFGSIRAGRGDDIKRRLVDRMCDAAAEVLGLERADVTMLTRDVEAQWAMEFGEVLPEPGAEAAWLARHAET